MKIDELRIKRQGKFAVWMALAIAGGLCLFLATSKTVFAQHRMHNRHLQEATPKHPWMNASLSPDERAEMVLKEMTLDEKILLLHGQGMPGWPREVQNPQPELGNGGAGFIMGIARLGIPFVQMSDAAYGIRSSAENGRYSTALPSDVGAAASWDPEAACAYGTVIGKELRAQGYNMTLGGGVNVTREPRNGRTFEYMGEDPILAGTLVGERNEVRAGTARDRRYQTLCGERSGERAKRSELDHRETRDAGERFAGVRNWQWGLRSRAR